MLQILDIKKSFGELHVLRGVDLDVEQGDVVAINFDTGVITDETNGKVFHAEPFPPFIQEIISAGGLMKSIKAKQ